MSFITGLAIGFFVGAISVVPDIKKWLSVFGVKPTYKARRPRENQAHLS